ncbi:hypothetical protein AAC387_Pa01g0541 [Persea americana]
MLRHCRQHFAAEELSVAAFGDVRGEALDAPQPASDALALPPPAATAAAVTAPAATTVARATPAAVAEVGLAPPPPAAIVIDNSPPCFSPRAEGRKRPAEAEEERQAEKRPRVKAPPGPSSPPLAEETLPPPPLIPWRPDIEGALGRPLAVTDPAGGNPQVIAALGRVCALPLDMAKWEMMDNESLLLSSMQSLIVVVQKSQIGVERLEVVEAKAVNWAPEREELQAEREGLQKALEFKDGLLRKEASKNAGLVADLEQAQAQATVEELETDAHMMRRANIDLATEARLARTRLEDALKDKAAELESALAKQKAELEEKYGAELDAVMGRRRRNWLRTARRNCQGSGLELGSSDGRQP